MDFSYHRLFLPQIICTMGGLFVPLTFCTMDDLYHGRFVLWTFRTKDDSYDKTVRTICKYSIRHMGVPCVTYSYSTECL